MKHLTQEEYDRLLAEAAEGRRLKALVNTPELVDFPKAVHAEACHQLERWGSNSPGGKKPTDWFGLVITLAGRALDHHKEAERMHALACQLYPKFDGKDLSTLPDAFVRGCILFHREKAAHHTITTAAALSHWHAAVIDKATRFRPGVDLETVIAAAGAIV